MFKRIQYSMVIEKAFLVWEGLFIPISARFKKLSFFEQAEFREGLRSLQKQGLELHDVAVMIIIPFLSSFSEAQIDMIRNWVSYWKSSSLVQTEVYEHFLEEVEKYS